MATFSIEQEKTIALLAAGCSQRETAKEVGIGRLKIRLWQQDEAFAHQVELTRLELMEQGIGRLSSRFAEMVDVLYEIAKDVNVQPQARLNAASKYIEHALKGYEQGPLLKLAKKLATEAEASKNGQGSGLVSAAGGLGQKQTAGNGRGERDAAEVDAGPGVDFFSAEPDAGRMATSGTDIG